jgi:hypothetical protein
MSFNVIFIIITIIIGILTVVVFNLLNHFFKWLSSNLTKIKPKDLSTVIPKINNTRSALSIALSTILATFIGLLSLTTSLMGTIFDPDFVTGELQNLDMATFATELLSKQSSDQLFSAVGKLSSVKLEDTATELSDQLNYTVNERSAEQLYGAESIQATLTELEPALREQVNVSVYSVYDYLSGKKSDLKLVIILETLKQALKEHFNEAVLRSPPPELKGASPEQFQSYVDVLYQQQFHYFPAKLELSSTITTAYGVIHLDEIRRVTLLLPLLPKILLIIISLLIVGIILFHRNIKIALWDLGIIFVTSGILGFLYAFIAKEMGMRIDVLMVLPSFNVWLIQIITDVLMTIKQPGYFLFSIGGMMLITSFLLLVASRKAGIPDGTKAVSKQNHFSDTI